MPSIVVSKFAGLVPRTSPRLISNGEATTCVMSKLWSGELRPFLDLGQVAVGDLPQDAPVRTLYLFETKWLAWTVDVDVVTGFTQLQGQGRIYWTGDGAPRQAFFNDIRFGPATPLHSSTFPVGVVGPTNAPHIVGHTDGPDGPETYSYVYTYYTTTNEESVPSPPSALVTVGAGAGQSVTLDLFPAPTDVPLYVKELRLYRTIGGTFIFVAAVPFPFPPSYTDAATDLDLAGNESLQSQEYYPPPADIQGLIGLSCGSLAAFHGNSVVFSEPYQPGAWPPAYEKIFDYPVVALGTFGQTLVVATTGFTYLVSGNDPRSFAVARVPDPYPCISKKSMVSTDNGVVYSSSDGLIFVGTPSYYTQGSGVHVVTRDLMTYNEWQVYNPSTIIGAIFDGRYYGFYEFQTVNPHGPVGGGFVYDFSNREKALITGVVEEAGSEIDKKDILLDVDFFATALFANPQVPLHLNIDTREGIERNKLYKWEGGSTYRELTWQSKEFSFPYAVTFSAVKVLALVYPGFEGTAGTLNFSVVDGVTGDVLYTKAITSANPFRLPVLSARTEWKFQIQSTVNVQLVQMATAFADLAERRAA